MPNIEMFIESIYQLSTNTKKSQQPYLPTIDLKDAYSQLQLLTDTAKDCKFKIICGEKTVTGLKTGFYGLTDMPAEFEKAMEYTFVGFQNTYCFLDIFTMLSIVSESDGINYVTAFSKKMNEDNLLINLQKVHFAKLEIEWLGYKFSQTKIFSHSNAKRRLYLQSHHKIHLNDYDRFLVQNITIHCKFMLYLAQLCQPLRPLL